MISKANAKFLKSLQIKKFRKQHNSFLVEGEKSVNELLTTNLEVQEVYATPKFIEQHGTKWEQRVVLQEVTDDQLSSVSIYKTNNAALAIVKIPENVYQNPKADELSLVLDSVNDPGNLGTIIRVADWYGIKHIYCSEDTVDVYSPKVIAATKGSFSRVALHYCNLGELLCNTPIPVLGAFLEGENIHQLQTIGKGALLVLGNEANGVSEEVSKFITRKITIPAFGEAESLNVAIATAIICDNLKRIING